MVRGALVIREGQVGPGHEGWSGGPGHEGWSGGPWS